MAAAATETAGSSSSGSADSYIGSLISLTSKSEIRYEGVLFNINSEESSIGLRNVRSFGTEGRRKDGPQVPPSDKIYEYILFRGSDIKDLQVKSSPPVQNTTSMHNDPAIIQSHYPQAASTALPSGTGSVPDSHVSQLGLARPPFQGNPPLYQPGGSLGAWGSSLLPSTSGGLAMPMYWQGFYGSSNGLQPQQQSLLQPPPGLSMLPSMQQSMQYHPMNLSIPTGASSLPSSQLSEHLPLLPPLGTGTSNLLSPMFPVQNSAIVSDSSANLVPDKAFTGTFSTAAPINSLPLAPPLSTGLDNTASARPVSEPKTSPGYIMPFKNISESASSNGVTSNLILKDGIVPSLVTPGQLLQPGLPPLTSAQTSQTAQKDVEVVQLSSTESPPPPTAASVATEVQEPILPLPSQPDRKLRGPPMYAQRGGRGGHGRGRANEISHSATRFTEDFDFMAMNEKFNKDEVWGDLGRTNRGQEDGDDVQDEDNVGKHESKPIYVKDDFFDSLSCDALDAGSRNGRTRFSEQVRRDTETFGDFPRFHGGRGGRGPFRGGRSRGGSHYGRGYSFGYGYSYENHGRGYGYGYGYENHGRGNGYENHGRGNGYENHGRGNAYAPRGRGYGMSGHASS